MATFFPFLHLEIKLVIFKNNFYYVEFVEGFLDHQCVGMHSMRSILNLSYNMKAQRQKKPYSAEI